MNYSKKNTSNGVTQAKTPQVGLGLSFGYITIPDTFDSESREKYIQTALRRERVSIIVEGGGTVLNDCLITKGALNNIEFPIDSKKLGSGVVFFKTSNGKVVITDVIGKNDETSLSEEHSFNLQKNYKDRFVSVKGNAEKGQLSVLLNTGASLSGDLSINVVNKAKDSKVRLNVAGDIETRATNNTSLSSGNDTNVVSENEINLHSKENTNIKVKKINVNNASEPVLLGSKTEDVLTSIQSILNDLNTKLSTFAAAQLAISTSIPVFSPLSAGYSVLITDLSTIQPEILEIINKINLIKSKIFFTD